MWSRVTRRRTSPDNLEATLSAYKTSMVPYVTSQPGNLGALVFVDRATGDILTVSMWEDTTSLNASIPNRPTAVSDAAGDPGTEKVYEIFARG
jgi:hypothetical protein